MSIHVWVRVIHQESISESIIYIYIYKYIYINIIKQSVDGLLALYQDLWMFLVIAQRAAKSR